MTIINPESTQHQLKVIPRFYPSGAVILKLTDKEAKTTHQPEIETSVLDGYMYITFTHTFLDNSSYSIEVLKDDDVVYRGKLFATTQAGNTQDFKITKDIFTI